MRLTTGSSGAPGLTIWPEVRPPFGLTVTGAARVEGTLYVRSERASVRVVKDLMLMRRSDGFEVLDEMVGGGRRFFAEIEVIFLLMSDGDKGVRDLCWSRCRKR